MKNYILIGIMLLSIIACKPQKFVNEYKGITKVDTFTRTQLRTVYRAVNDTVTIYNACDSTGILNEFYTKISIPFGSLKIRAHNNKIESIVATDKVESNSIKEKSNSTSNSIREVSKEVIKYRIPAWIIYTLIIETLLIALYIYLRVQRFIK